MEHFASLDRMSGTLSPTEYTVDMSSDFQTSSICSGVTFPRPATAARSSVVTCVCLFVC